MDRIYKIPLLERFMSICGAGDWFSCYKIMEVDNIGLYVYYQKEEDITIKNIRSHLIGVKDQYIIVLANNIGEAITKFYSEWKGATTGGRQHKAIWINPDKNIIEYPGCKLLNINKNEEFICGKEVIDDEYANNCGEFGWCTLGGYDPIDGCPVEIYNDFNRTFGDQIKTFTHPRGLFTYESCDKFIEWYNEFMKITGRC